MHAWFGGLSPILQALIATLGTWLLTALGAALVFLFEQPAKWLQDGALGFAGGVMVAASCWSLLIPALERGGILPALVGLALGGVFILLLDRALDQRNVHIDDVQGKGKGILLLVFVITLHNIPEGAAVGVAFGAERLGAAIALAIGIGLQNFPEGLAVSLPLKRAGLSRFKAFFYGQLSALVEPVAGVLGALLVTSIRAVLPYGLSFAAGAMLFVVVDEMIPEAVEDRRIDAAAIGFLIGFAVMMTLDTTLGQGLQVNFLDFGRYPLWINLVAFAAAALAVWFAGVLLLGGITSLPEIMTIGTASAIGNAPLAVN